ncbi:MAG: ThuA domain-containing protein [Prolixibacteraceae bacterium]|nr:ThuA domain-containing protein [Prolixibacteraceae bacterium]
MKKVIGLLLAVLLTFSFADAKKVNVKGKRILIYTKNGKGYVHDNIATSVKALQEICAKEGILTDVSDDPAVFTPGNLEKYDALFFRTATTKVSTPMLRKKHFRIFAVVEKVLAHCIRPMPPRGNGRGTGLWWAASSFVTRRFKNSM